MSKTDHMKLANFFYVAYLAEKEKNIPDEFMMRYFQDMQLFHESKEK